MEVAIVLIIALIVFGPKKLPSLGRSVGQGFAEFKNGLSADNSEQPEAPVVTEVTTEEKSPA